MECMESRAKVLGHSVHQILIVFPLGLLATSFIFDIVYLAADSARYALISFYMIAAGIIGGLIAALFGLIDFLAIPKFTRARKIGAMHGLGLVASGAGRGIRVLKGDRGHGRDDRRASRTRPIARPGHAPSISTRFRRDDSPLTITTSRLATPKCAASAATTPALAAPSTARSRTKTVSEAAGSSGVASTSGPFRLPGLTRTVTSTTPPIGSAALALCDPAKLSR